LIQNRTYLFILLLNLLIADCFSQTPRLDSLKTVLTTAKVDSAKFEALSKLTELADEGEWQKYNNDLLIATEKKLQDKLTAAEEKLYTNYLASAYNNLGIIQYNLGNTKEAIEAYKKSIALFNATGNKINISSPYNNIALIYSQIGDYNQALYYFSQSQKIAETINDAKNIATCYNNIALIYSEQGDNTKALEYFTKSLKLNQKAKNTSGEALVLQNIASVYEQSGNCAKALPYIEKSYAIRKQQNDVPGMAECFNTFGRVYKGLNRMPEALESFNECMRLNEELKLKDHTTTALINLGNIYLLMNDIPQALSYAKKAHQYSLELGYPGQVSNTAHLLYLIYKKQKQDGLALEMFMQQVAMNDSLNNLQARKTVLKSQLKYEYEKKAAADSVKVAEEKKVTQIKLKQDETQRYFLYSGLALTIVFGSVMSNRFRVAKKQKNVIAEQKNIAEKQKQFVDEKQKEIMDSIHYAKRIQTSLLPTEKYIQRIIKH